MPETPFSPKTNSQDVPEVSLPEGAMDEQVFDMQHDTDPAHEVPPARRIPHLGHTALFFSLALSCVLLCSVVALGAVHASSIETAAQHPLAVAGAQAFAYVLTIVCAVPLFPVVWKVPFFEGIHWNWRAVARQWWKLALVGVGLSLMAQLADHFVQQPEQVDLLALFKTPASAWATAIFGSVLPAFMEEIAFRGFLLPSLATAYDWLALDRSPAGLERWQRTVTHSLPGWVFGTVFSSLVFAGLHAGQLHGAWGPVAVLFAVSVAFSAVRIKTGSVAASFLAHAVYDGLIFAEMVVVTGGFRHLDKI